MSFFYTIKGALRRATRLVVVQLLYQIEQQTDLRAEDVEADFMRLLKDEQELTTLQQPKVKPRTNGLDTVFMRKLLLGVTQNKDKLDEKIKQFLHNNWSIPRISVVLVIILRMAVYEMRLKETPKEVVINEYIEITKEFFPDSDAFFINGMLDNIAKDLKNELC